MALYDIAKTQKLMSETKTDKEIANSLYDYSKQIVKELAQDFQLTDNNFKNLIEDILEFNMPKKPNPFQNWHEIDDPNTDLHIDEFTGEKLPKTPKAINSITKGLAHAGKGIKILQNINAYQNILKSVKGKKNCVKFSIF